VKTPTETFITGLREKIVRLTAERSEARAAARVLARAYTTDNRPPADVVERALAYPVWP
jgi:hypothetical protein